MKHFFIFICCFWLALPTAFAQRKIERLDWNGLEVVWLEDDRFPTFNITINFADGSFSDNSQRAGETSMALSQLTAGTRRYDQREITENLEYYGIQTAGFASSIYSYYSLSGLVKDLIPAAKMVCHLFADATYPKSQIDIEKNRSIEALTNMVSRHGALASRALTELTRAGTPFPSTAKIADIRRTQPEHLHAKLAYLNTKVKKRLYITGPRSVLDSQKIFNEECGWTEQKELFVRQYPQANLVAQNGLKIYLVPVKGANQAQVALGRILHGDLVTRHEAMTMASDFLSSGFTSILMRELRARRGLTYSVGSYANAQKEYGRSGISTSTKNESLPELLNVIKTSLEAVIAGDFQEEEFTAAKKGVSGSYPFQFERSSSYLSRIMELDLADRNINELYQFQERIMALKVDDIKSMTDFLFNWNQLTLVVVGDRSLEKSLKEFGKVEIVEPERIL